jgi:hypothetical protein
VQGWTSLVYEFQDGPGIQVGGSEFKKIAVLRIVNDGNGKLTNVKGGIVIDNSAINMVTKSDSYVDNVEVVINNNGFNYKIRTLTRGEEQTFSIMYTCLNSCSEPKITLKSDESIGKSRKPEKADNIRISAIVSVISTFMMLILMKSKTFRKFIQRHIARISREDIIAHVVCRLGIEDLYHDSLKLSELTYYRFADLSFAHAQKYPERSVQIAAALEIFLGIKGIAELSLDNMENTLVSLGLASSARVKALRKEAVDSLVALKRFDESTTRPPITT